MVLLIGNIYLSMFAASQFAVAVSRSSRLTAYRALSWQYQLCVFSFNIFFVCVCVGGGGYISVQVSRASLLSPAEQAAVDKFSTPVQSTVTPVMVSEITMLLHTVAHTEK